MPVKKCVYVLVTAGTFRTVCNAIREAKKRPWCGCRESGRDRNILKMLTEFVIYPLFIITELQGIGNAHNAHIRGCEGSPGRSPVYDPSMG